MHFAADHTLHILIGGSCTAIAQAWTAAKARRSITVEAIRPFFHIRHAEDLLHIHNRQLAIGTPPAVLSKLGVHIQTSE